MNRRPIKLIGSMLIVGVLAAACGDTDDGDSAANDTTTTAEARVGEGTESRSSELRATLTALLQEHVYLAGITTGTALSGGDLAAPAATLEANTQDLQDAITSVYGDAGGEQFGDLWRKHIGFFVDYTTGKATDDAAKVEQARADLDGYRADFGAFIESATKGALPKDAVAEELKAHVDSLFAAIDAQAASDPKAFDLLKEAAHHMPMTAAVLAGAISGQFPDKFSGASDSGAAELRSGLTALLQEHVYLAGITTGTALSGGDLAAPAATLEANTQDLQDAITSVYGDAGGEQFGDLWRKHIGFFVDYTTGKATDDAAKVEQARADLDGYRADFGAFIESATKGALPKDAVAEELKAHVESLFAAIDAQAASDPKAFDLLKEAAHHMPMTAAVLSGAIAGQFPDKFGG